MSFQAADGVGFGVGKTTLATNLARSFQLRGRDVILVDTDPQGSARDWAATQEEIEVPLTVGVDRPAGLEKELPRLDGRFEICVVDGAAKVERMSVAAIKAADLILIPVQPSALDVWTAGELVELIKARQEVTGRPEAAFVVSRAITGTRLADSARDALGRLELPVLSFGALEEQIKREESYARHMKREKPKVLVDDLKNAVFDFCNEANEVDDLAFEAFEVAGWLEKVHEVLKGHLAEEAN